MLTRTGRRSVIRLVAGTVLPRRRLQETSPTSRRKISYLDPRCKPFWRRTHQTWTIRTDITSIRRKRWNLCWSIKLPISELSQPNQNNLSWRSKLLVPLSRTSTRSKSPRSVTKTQLGREGKWLSSKLQWLPKSRRKCKRLSWSRALQLLLPDRMMLNSKSKLSHSKTFRSMLTEVSLQPLPRLTMQKRV